jgi:hypothetical protein
MTKHWLISLDNMGMQTYKQDKNSSIYPLPLEGNCYFLTEKTGFGAQSVDVSRFSTLIDHGQAISIFSGHFGCSVVHPDDEAGIYIGYLDANWTPIVLRPGKLSK